MSKGLFTSMKKNDDEQNPVEAEGNEVPSVEQPEVNASGVSEPEATDTGEPKAPNETVSPPDPNETPDPRDVELAVLKEKIAELEKMMKFSSIEQGTTHQVPAPVSLLDLMRN